MKSSLCVFSFFVLSTFFSHIDGQVKTLIPADQEVDLPMDSTGEVGLSTVFNETKFSSQEIKSLFVQEGISLMDKSRFYLIDSTGERLEYFVVYPCKSYSLEGIQSHEIVSEGLIVHTIVVLFQKDEYEVKTLDFEWVDKQKRKKSITELYRDYQKSTDIRFRVRNYGILKSAENSFIQTMEQITIIIQEIINKKTPSK